MSKMYENARQLFEQLHTMCNNQGLYLSEVDYSTLDGKVADLKVMASYSHPLAEPKGKITNREKIGIHLNADEERVVIHTSRFRPFRRGQRVQEALVRGLANLDSAKKEDYGRNDVAFYADFHIIAPAGELYDEIVDLEVKLTEPSLNGECEPEEDEVFVGAKFEPGYDPLSSVSDDDEDSSDMVNSLVQY